VRRVLAGAAAEKFHKAHKALADAIAAFNERLEAGKTRLLELNGGKRPVIEVEHIEFVDGK